MDKEYWCFVLEGRKRGIKEELKGRKRIKRDQREFLIIFNSLQEKKNAVRTLTTDFSTHAFYEKHRGKLVDGSFSPFLSSPSPSLTPLPPLPPNIAVVDQVRNGSTIKVVVVGSFEYLTVRFAGVLSPFPSGQEEPPFTREAKAIIEQVLLGRDVQLALECIDKVDGVFARVLCGGRDPAELLLQVIFFFF